MKWARAQARATGTTKDCRDAGAPAIAALGGVVGEQIESGGDEINELKLRHGPHTHQRRAAGRAHNCAFRNRCVDNTSAAKLVEQAVCYFEGSAIGADVFADHKDRRVALHLFPDALSNCFDKRRLAAARWRFE